MFKKIILATLLISVTFTHKSAQAMDPRVKVIAVNAGYGTVGGALLGTAALAFGSSSRSVAIGASLGLYAGLIFGGYVVGSHEYKKYQRSQPSNREEDYYYPDTDGSPYQDSYNKNGSGYDYQANRDLSEFGPAEIGFKPKKQGQDFYVNLLNYQF